MKMSEFTPIQAEIFSDRMADAQWDRLVLKSIPLKNRLTEASLYFTKWWDYRPIHPAHATTLFARAYGDAWRRSSDRRDGTEENNWRLNSSPFRTMDWNPFLEAQPRLNAFWKARQYCDEARMPYEFYCSQFFNLAEDYFESLPRPQEMYRRDVIIPVLDNWSLIKESGVFTTVKHPDYNLRYNWDNKRHQIEFEDRLLAWLREKPKSVRQWYRENNENFFRNKELK